MHLNLVFENTYMYSDALISVLLCRLLKTPCDLQSIM
jgi:hypothetical protein